MDERRTFDLASVGQRLKTEFVVPASALTVQMEQLIERLKEVEQNAIPTARLIVRREDT